MFKQLGILTALACIGLAGGQATAQDGAVPQELKGLIPKCEQCHGPSGNSRSGMIPRINGQNAQYLTSRFFAFQDPTRQIRMRRTTCGRSRHRSPTRLFRNWPNIFPNRRRPHRSLSVPWFRKAEGFTKRARSMCLLASPVTALKVKVLAQFHDWPANTESIFAPS